MRRFLPRSNSNQDPNLFVLTDKTKLKKSHWKIKEISRKEEGKCMEAIRDYCNEKKIHISSALIFRFACYNKFNIDKTKKDIKNRHDSPYLFLTMNDELVSHISSFHMVVPMPQLKTKHNNMDCIYFNPETWRPNTKDNRLLLENFCYALNYVARTKLQCRRGVACIANFRNYSMKNYHVGAIMKMIQAAQGDLVPTNVQFMLIVDPPAFFRTTWNVIKRAISSDFLKKVHLIRRERLDEFLMEGYEDYLPSEMQGGIVDKGEVVEDWIDSTSYQERMSIRLLDESTLTTHSTSMRVDDAGQITIDSLSTRMMDKSIRLDKSFRLGESSALLTIDSTDRMDEESSWFHC